ncbi:D-cysteine desulfhydrase family protein [Streptomyces sp. NPDC005827]|uniref:D-cysteine desulfhydrase family protein n=1 Tax=Streptomyces sp. NPDC005827 TaxID=3157070 RepID=UPI0033CC43DC
MHTTRGEQRRVTLAAWPTPLEPAPRLARALGLGPDDLWIKRDDLIGLGGGGNKVRKLEWTCGQALAEGARTLVTSGAPQSNHARLTAAAGARLGMDVVLVLAGEPAEYGSGSDGVEDTVTAAGNLALDGLLGAGIVWAGAVGGTELAAVLDRVVGELRERDAAPALIPFGGSSPVGALGYVEGGRELLAQAPDLATAVVALGSGGTMAGLVHALGPERVLGVHCGAVADPARTVDLLLTGLYAPSPAPRQPPLRLRLDQVGAGYSRLTEPVADALLLAARTEGLVLDPVYTGRAMAGLVAAVREGDIRPGERTVFVHTGGLPGLFGHPEALVRAGEALAARTM